MKKKVLVCATSHDLDMGGVQTYYMRMFEWAEKNKYKKILLLREDCKIYDLWQKKIKNLGIEIFHYSLCLAKIVEKDEFTSGKEEEFIFLTADIHCFFQVKRLIEKSRLLNSKIIFYVLHPESTRICENRFLNYPYRKWFMSELNNNVIFMDRETINSCENFYNIALKPYKYFRLGKYIPSPNSELVETRTRKRKKQFRILSISRFEFPFKGYVLGLVDTFERLIHHYPYLSLEIIGDGVGKEKVLNKINCLAPNIKKYITYHEIVPYDKLEQHICESNLLVGMGTTLLDAACYSLPSIVATAFQNGDMTVGVFSNEYDNVGGNLKFSLRKNLTLYGEIEKILNMTDKDYKKLQQNTYDVVNKYYNIEEIMPEIMKIDGKMDFNRKNKGYFVLVLYDIFIVFLKKIVHRVRRKK